MATPTPSPSPQVAAPRRATTKVDDALSGAEALARLVADGVSGSGVKGLEGPVKTVLGILSHVKRVRDNSKACKDVIQQINALLETLQNAADTVVAQVTAQSIPATLAQTQLGSSGELSSRISRLQQRLHEINTDAAGLQKQSRFKRVAMANRNADVLKDISERLREARGDFMLTGQLAIEHVLRELAAEVKAAREYQAAAELDSALEKLPYVDASYKASVHARHGRLLAGTRVELLKDLKDWAACATDEDKALPFYVLSGGAGTGKSTIAYEVASDAEKKGNLGASFFFMRGAALLSSTEVFFPTLARQLITNIPELKASAASIIHDHLKHGMRQNMDQQAKDFFTGLLSRIPHDHSPIVLVIDAVDECTESAQDLVPRMLFLIMDGLSIISCPMRIFVTSRPEVHVEDAFQSTRFISSAQNFRLHEVPRSCIDSDIRLYFRTALAKLRESSGSPLSISYPDAAEDLTDLAAGLFIYAATAVEFLKQYRHADIVRGMDLLIATRHNASRAALGRLDDLYTIVLSVAFPREVLAVKKADVQTVLGCVVVLQDHISPRTLAALTNMSLHRELLPIVERLGAVLSVDPLKPDVTMRPLHASFAEFLVDVSRCSDPNFFIDKSMQHSRLLKNCLHWLLRPSGLVRNICRLPDPLLHQSEIDDRTSRIAQHIPLPLQYSCTYWPTHAAQSHSAERASRLLAKVCDTKLLEWLEALAFLDGIDIALAWLPRVYDIYSSEDPGSPLAALLYDILRIAFEFSPAIKLCPGQLYVSCLTLSPSACQLRTAYADALSTAGTLQHRGEITEHWTPWLDIVPSGSTELNIIRILSIHFAPHGRWLATCGTADGAIHLCAPDTGAVVQSIIGHSQPVEHLDIASNGLRIVSTSQGRLCILSTRSGAVIDEVSRSDQVPGKFGKAFFVLDGAAVLLLERAFNPASTTLHIWDLKTRALSSLEYLTVPLRASQPHIDVSSNGRWVIVIDTVTTWPPHIRFAYVLDLVAEVEMRRIPYASSTAAFIPHTETAIMDVDGSLCIVDIATGDNLRSMNIDATGVFRISVSQDGAHMVALSRFKPPTPDAVHVWSSSGASHRFSLGGIFDINLTPDGRRVVGLLGAAWRMIDAQGTGLADTETEPHAEDNTVTYAIDVASDGAGYAVARHDLLSLYDANLGLSRSISLPEAPVLEGMPPSLLDLETKPRSVAFSPDAQLVVVVRLRQLLVYDHVTKTAEGRIVEVPVDALLNQQGDDADRKATVTYATFGCATFTPNSSQLLAFINVAKVPGLEGRLCIACWDLAEGILCWILIPPVRITGAITPVLHISNFNRALVVAREGERQAEDSPLELCVSAQGLSQPAVSYRMLLGASESAAVERSAGMPDERFCLTKDGWIRHIASHRPLCWLPRARRPSYVNFSRSVANRGAVIAIVASSGLLTVLDMSAFD